MNEHLKDYLCLNRKIFRENGVRYRVEIKKVRLRYPYEEREEWQGRLVGVDDFFDTVNLTDFDTFSEWQKVLDRWKKMLTK